MPHIYLKLKLKCLEMETSAEKSRLFYGGSSGGGPISDLLIIKLYFD